MDNDPTPDEAGQPSPAGVPDAELLQRAQELVDDLERRGVYARRAQNAATEAAGLVAFICEECGEPADRQHALPSFIDEGTRYYCAVHYGYEVGYATADDQWYERREQEQRAARRPLPPPPSLGHSLQDMIDAGARWFAERARRLRGHRGGQPPGPTHDPAFLAIVVEHAWDYRDKNGVVPSAAVLVEKLGVGRTPYFDWLKASGLTSTDVKLAASKRTISDGVSFLSALQQERRKERNSDRE